MSKIVINKAVKLIYDAVVLDRFGVYRHFIKVWADYKWEVPAVLVQASRNIQIYLPASSDHSSECECDQGQQYDMHHTDLHRQGGAC